MSATFQTVGWHGAVTGSFTVDDADAAAVGAFRWNLGSKGYVIRTDRSGGRKTTVRLHRWLLGLDIHDRRQVDHINGDVTDYCRSNLRVVAPAANAQNRKPRGGRRYRGVYHAGDANRARPWRATVRNKHVGYFATEEEAARAAAQVRATAMPYAVEGRHPSR